MPRVFDPITGQWVPVGPLGSNPGIGIQRARDLYSRLPAADIAGARGPGVVPGGEQSVGARRAVEMEQIPESPTRRPLSGAQENNRGGAISVELDGSYPASRIDSVVETPKDCGDDAELISVTLGLQLPASMNPVIGVIPSAYQSYVEATAILTWGVGSAFYEAEVDWGVGTRFEIAASYVRVGLSINANTLAPSSPFKALFSASLSYGGARNGIAAPARRTQMLVDPNTGTNSILAGATSDIFVIPPFARSFTLLGNQATGLNASVFVGKLCSGGPTPGESIRYEVSSFGNTAHQHEQQFPIPNGARFIAVTNNSADELFYPTVVYTLGF